MQGYGSMKKSIKDELLGTALIYIIAGLVLLGVSVCFWIAYH